MAQDMVPWNDPRGLMRYLYGGNVEGGSVGSAGRIAGLLGQDALEGQFTRVPGTAGLLGRAAGKIIPPVGAAFALNDLYNNFTGEESLPADYQVPQGFGDTPYGKAITDYTGGGKGGGKGSFGVLKEDANIGANPYADKLYADLLKPREGTPAVTDYKAAPKDPGQLLQEVTVQGKKLTPIDLKDNSEGLVQQMTADLPEEDATAIEGFSDMFDLTTVGMALLATNDGSSNVGVNLGKALMLGRQAKMEQNSAAIESAREDRKETRAEKKLRIDAAKAIAEAEKAAALAGKYGAETQAIPQQLVNDTTRADAAVATANAAQASAAARWLSARASMIKAQQGPTTETATQKAQRLTNKAAMGSYFEATGIYPDFADLDQYSRENLAVVAANELENLMANGGDQLPPEQARKLAAEFALSESGLVNQPTLWGFGDNAWQKP